MAAAEPADEQPAMRRWHDHDWEEVLAGRGTAERYFVRSGLVRKDRLLAFVPKARHPPTVVVRSLAELQQGLQDLGAGSAVEGIRFVLKKAHSSNAHGIRFLSDADATALQLWPLRLTTW
ncbi:unnamed protein product, partial [Effrenium voratum]